MSTPAEIQDRLNLYLEAERRVLKNQSYTIGQRTFTMTSLPAIQRAIKSLKSELSNANGNPTMTTRGIVFRDD